MNFVMVLLLPIYLPSDLASFLAFYPLRLQLIYVLEGIYIQNHSTKWLPQNLLLQVESPAQYLQAMYVCAFPHRLPPRKTGKFKILVVWEL